MNRIRFRSTMTMWGAAVVLALAGAAYGQASHVYHGEVSDSQCAMNVHTRSHQEMLKSKSMGGTSNTCSVYCIEHLGGYLVLSAGNDVYRSTGLIWCMDLKDRESCLPASSIPSSSRFTF